MATVVKILNKYNKNAEKETYINVNFGNCHSVPYIYKFGFDFVLYKAYQSNHVLILFC